MRRPQNWKKSPTCFSVKTNGIFFQIFVAFSEKLNFMKYAILSSIKAEFETRKIVHYQKFEERPDWSKKRGTFPSKRFHQNFIGSKISSFGEINWIFLRILLLT